LIRKQIHIPFKGNRTYIQGPDLYNAMLKELAGEQTHDIRFSAHGFIRKNSCILYIVDELSEVVDRLPLPAQLKYRTAEEEKFIFIEEGDTSDTTPKRIGYDERLIQQLCRIDEASISIVGTSPFSFIETVVSMKKEMLSQRYPDASGQWVFTKIELKNRFEEQNELKVQILHNMEFRLIKSSLFYKSEKIGHLYFSLVKK